MWLTVRARIQIYPWLPHSKGYFGRTISTRIGPPFASQADRQPGRSVTSARHAAAAAPQSTDGHCADRAARSGDHFGIFADPSDTGTWDYRVEGHHLGLHFTVSKRQVVDTLAREGAKMTVKQRETLNNVPGER